MNTVDACHMLDIAGRVTAEISVAATDAATDLKVRESAMRNSTVVETEA